MGIRAMITQSPREKSVATTVMRRRFRIFSISPTAGIWISSAIAGIAAMSPITRLDAPSSRANAMRKMPPVRVMKA